MSLSDITASYLAQFPDGAAADLQRNEVLLERFGRVASAGFGLVLLTAIGGILYVILTKMILSGQNPSAGVLLMAFICFAVLTLAYVLMKESLDEKKQKLISLQSVPELASPTDVFLASNQSASSSVVENTTDLLAVETRTHKLK